MRYGFEYHPNTNCVSLHVTTRLTEEGFVSRACDIKDANFRLLFGLLEHTDGVEEVTIRPYQISATCGVAFTREEVCEKLLETLKMFYPNEPFEQRPTLRTDLRHRQCSACKSESDAAWEEFAGDMDRLERD